LFIKIDIFDISDTFVSKKIYFKHNTRAYLKILNLFLKTYIYIKNVSVNSILKKGLKNICFKMFES